MYGGVSVDFDALCPALPRFALHAEEPVDVPSRVLVPDIKLNINALSDAQIKGLHGIPKAVADAIIEYRNSKGTHLGLWMCRACQPTSRRLIGVVLFHVVECVAVSLRALLLGHAGSPIESLLEFKQNKKISSAFKKLEALLRTT